MTLANIVEEVDLKKYRSDNRLNIKDKPMIKAVSAKYL